jgi:HEAT repeat protein
MTYVSSLERLIHNQLIEELVQFVDLNDEKRIEGLKEQYDSKELKELLDGQRLRSTDIEEIRDKRAVSTLIKALDSPKRELRSAAVVALGKIREEEAVPSLTYLVMNDRSQMVRYFACTALGWFDGEEVRRALRFVAENDEIEIVRENAQRNLNFLDDEKREEMYQFMIDVENGKEPMFPN